MKGSAAARFTRLALVLLSINTGCITYREGQLPPITHWPPEANTVKPSISLAVSGKAFDNGQELDVLGAEMVHNGKMMALRAYQDSDLFSDVKVGTAETDLRAEINITDRGEGNSAIPYVSGFTMGLVPCSASDAFTVSTTLKDRQGTTISTFQKQETSTLWIQLFLVFAMPFRSAEEHPIYDLNRATILEAQAKGFL